MAMCGIKILWE